MKDLESLGVEIAGVARLIHTVSLLVQPISGNSLPETGSPSRDTVQMCFMGVCDHLERIGEELIEMSRYIDADALTDALNEPEIETIEEFNRISEERAKRLKTQNKRS